MSKILLTAVGLGVVGLIVLVALWPSPRTGRRLLARWGVGEPTDDELAVAVSYLRRRRFWYPWLFFGIPLLAQAVSRDARTETFSTVVVTLLLGALVAELLAQRPAHGPRREAAVRVRTLRDVLPRWTLVCAGLAVALLAIVGTASALDAGWTARLMPRAFTGIALVTGAVTVVVLAAVLYLTVRRPPTGTERVDAALRTRSARVVTGLAVGMCCSLSGSVGDVLAGLVTVLGLIGWSAVAGPPPKLRVRRAVPAEG